MRITGLITLALACALSLGCSSITTVDTEKHHSSTYASDARHSGEKIDRFAPVFLVHSPQLDYNRIGTPIAILGEDGEEIITIDPDTPAIYVETRTFTTERGSYTNYIYRVHFLETPHTFFPITITAGDNPGLIVIITVDGDGQPLLVSQAGTCGCYIAILPTDHLDPSAYPGDWDGKPLSVYGETLGPVLKYQTTPFPRLLLEIRPGTHRVMGMQVLTDQPGKVGQLNALGHLDVPLVDEAELHRLPLGDRTTSFYFEEGSDKGYVKGSTRIWELLLMSWWAFDPDVGQDKDYGDPDNPFYTSLKFWARRDSDMADFPSFLQYWGWKL